MTRDLETITTGWDQPSVNAANDIILKNAYNALDWAGFFHTYFSSHRLTSDLFNYLWYPTFGWFDDATHYKLQFALNGIATARIAAVFRDHATDVGRFLDQSPDARADLMSWLNFMWNVGPHAASSIDREANFEWFQQLIAQYAGWLSSNVHINFNDQPYANYVRMQLQMDFRDTLPLSAQVQRAIATTLGLSGAPLQLWDTHGALIHDNQFLQARDYEFLQTLWDHVPAGLPLPGNLSVNDALGNSGSRFLFSYNSSGINVAAIHVGDARENGFPTDVTPFYTDVFALVAIHESNHVVNHISIESNPALKAQQDALLLDAGSDHLNYLRSVIPDGTFVNAPQEFFASMSNMYVANTELTFQVGVNRLQQQGRHQPIEQFLFFVDIYSQQTDVSRGYVVDTNATLTAYDIPLQRDAQKRIVAITLPKGRYMFSYGSDGHVASVVLQH